MKSLKRHLHTYKDERKRIVEVSEGKIDPNKHYSIAKGTMGLWYNFIKGVSQPDKINNDEADFIKPFMHVASHGHPNTRDKPTTTISITSIHL